MTDAPRTKIAKVNFTMTPNMLFDLIPDMSDNELRVMMVAVRQVIGWHVENPQPMAKSWFVNRTGRSRASVSKGIKEATKRGWLIKIDCNGPNGESRYTLNFDHEDWPEPMPEDEECEGDSDDDEGGQNLGGSKSDPLGGQNLTPSTHEGGVKI